MASDTFYQYLPWSWQITPIDPADRDCPSPAHILIVYCATTIATTIAGLILGCQPVARKWSFGKLGKESQQSSSWAWAWLIQLGLHFGSDLVNAYLVVHADGYNTELMPQFWDLALFYTTRPRLAWIILTFLGFRESWRSMAKQTLIVEAVMQIVGCYYFGITAHFAAKNSYYKQWHYEHAAQLMYGGALLTLITTMVAVLALIFTLTWLYRHNERPKYPRHLLNLCVVALPVSLGLVAFLGRWCFLVGFVWLAGDAYCLPI